MKWRYTIGLVLILLLVSVILFLPPVNAVSNGDPAFVVDNDLNYLPIIAKTEVAVYFDDFSNPDSGWPISEDDRVHTEYLNDEYRMLTKVAGYLYLLKAPIVPYETYTVSVDAAWAVEKGSGYGLAFGMNADIDQFYAFLISPEFSQYWFMRGENDDVVILDFGEIDSGLNMGSNHIQVTRYGSQIQVVVNDDWERSWTDASFSGLSYTGLAASTSLDQGLSDIRFDNYLLTSPVFASEPAVEIGIMPSHVIKVTRFDFP